MTIKRPSKQFLIDLLQNDPMRSTRDIFALVQKDGYTGGYTSLSNFVRVLRKDLGLSGAGKVAASRNRGPKQWEGREAYLRVLAIREARRARKSKGAA
jgi:hypothetical protein